MTDEAARIYLARELTMVEAADRHVGKHEEADMPTSWMPLDAAVDAVLAEQLHNPIAVMGVLAAARARDAGWAGLRPADAPDGCR